MHKRGFCFFLSQRPAKRCEVARRQCWLYSKSYLMAKLVVAMGGRVAEELVYGEEEITTGASSDLQQVMSIARRMVTQWGFANDKLSTVAWESMEDGGMFGPPQSASPKTLAEIDVEVQKIVENAYQTCKKTLKENRELMDQLVERLIEVETVNYQEFAEMVMDHKTKNAIAA